jgi:hypothetical protein
MQIICDHAIVPYRAHAEQAGNSLLHFRFPCLQEAHAPFVGEIVLSEPLSILIAVQVL